MKYIKKYLQSKYSIIFLLTFTNGLSFAMLIPVLPSVIRSYEVPEFYLGILLGTYSLFQFLATPILGKLSDKYGRKPLLLITQAGTMLSWLILGSAYLLPETQLFGLVLLPILVLFLARSIDGITGGNTSVAQAVLADKSESDTRSETFGKNSAVMGFAIIVGPALGSLSMSSSISFMGTAILGAVISLITLIIIYLGLTESLKEENQKDEITITGKKINIISQYLKWKEYGVVSYAATLRFLLFVAFVSGTSISTLYLLDTFGFTQNNIGYYLAFTGTFIIFHQTVSIKKIIGYFGDRTGLLVGLGIMSAGYMSMALSGGNIYLYTISNFLLVLGIATCFSTNSGLFSKSVDDAHQGEILGFSSSLKSFVSIWVPTVATLIYGSITFSIYYIIAVIPFIALLIGKLYFGKPEYK